MIQVNGLYRHFKGCYVVVNNVATIESTKEPCVVYTHVDTHETWVRPLSEFFADVSDREDNVTKQVHRFESAEDLNDTSALTTQKLVEALEKRPDNPYDGIKKLEEDEDVWDIQYMIGKVVSTPSEEDDEAYNYEFIPYVPSGFSTYKEASDYRDRHYVHKPCTIVRRVIRKVD